MLIGRGGKNMRKIYTATNAKIRVRGRGSGHLEVDGKKEAPVPLMVAVTANKADADGFKLAVEMTLANLKDVGESFEQFCHQRGLEPPKEPVYSIGELSKGAELLLRDVLPPHSQSVAAPPLEIGEQATAGGQAAALGPVTSPLGGQAEAFAQAPSPWANYHPQLHAAGDPARATTVAAEPPSPWQMPAISGEGFPPPLSGAGLNAAYMAALTAGFLAMQATHLSPEDAASFAMARQQGQALHGSPPQWELMQHGYPSSPFGTLPSPTLAAPVALPRVQAEVEPLPGSSGAPAELAPDLENEEGELPQLIMSEVSAFLGMEDGELG